MKVQLFILLILILSGSIIPAHAQVQGSKKIPILFSRAESNKNQFDYQNAIRNYYTVLSYDPRNHKALVEIAGCYFKLNDYKQSLLFYDSSLNYGTLYPPHGFRYADVLLKSNRRDRAVLWLTSYIKDHPNDTLAAQKLKGMEKYNLFLKDSSLFSIKSLPINSEKSEFSPAFYLDGLIFVSDRDKTKSSKQETQSYLDLYYFDFKKNDSSASVTPLNSKINSKLNEGPAAVFNHDSRIIFTRNLKNNGAKKTEKDIVYFQLFNSKKDKNGEWEDPTLIFNEKGISIGHPTISRNGEVLYFVSTMPGGYGGADIYKSRWQNNKWSTPENIGPNVNTQGNEMFPFIFNDSLLYFSSDGYAGLGGLDIFKKNLNGSKEVYNLGYPINTEKDDFGMIVYPEGTNGFLSSNRDGGKGGDDIYEFHIQSTPPKNQEELVAKQAEINVFYTIQILALRNPKLVARSFVQNLKGVVKHVGKDGLQRYTYGEYKGAQDAFEMLEVIRSMGYRDAFIRRVELYKELSNAPGENIDEIYMRTNKHR